MWGSVWREGVLLFVGEVLLCVGEVFRERVVLLYVGGGVTLCGGSLWRERGVTVCRGRCYSV